MIDGTEDYYAAPARSLPVMSPTEEARLLARYGAARGAARQRFLENPSTLVRYLVFNTARGPFADAWLRRAVNFAIDRKTSRPQGALGPSRPTTSYLPPAYPASATTPSYPPGGNLARARAWPEAGITTLHPDHRQPPPWLQRAQIVQSNLAKIGIDVHIQPLSVSQLIKHELDPHASWDLATIGWTLDFLDPANVLNAMLRGPSAHNKLGNFAHSTTPPTTAASTPPHGSPAQRASPPTPNSTPTSPDKPPRWPQ